MALTSLAAATCVGLFCWRPCASALAVLTFSFATGVLVNPFQRGLGPITSSPLTAAAKELGIHRTRRRWGVAHHGALQLVGPDGGRSAHNQRCQPVSRRRCWRVLDPNGASNDAWGTATHRRGGY